MNVNQLRKLGTILESSGGVLKENLLEKKITMIDQFIDIGSTDIYQRVKAKGLTDDKDSYRAFLNCQNLRACPEVLW